MNNYHLLKEPVTNDMVVCAKISFTFCLFPLIARDEPCVHRLPVECLGLHPTMVDDESDKYLVVSSEYNH